jgi:hypothetical protein
MRNRRQAILAVAVLAALILPSAYAGAATYDWTDARHQAERASASEAEQQWGKLSYLHVRLGFYYQSLTDLSAHVLAEITRRRQSYEQTAPAAAVHAFIATGQYDSALAWAERDPALASLRQVTLACSQDREIHLGAGGEAVSDADRIDALLTALHHGASEAELQTIAAGIGQLSPGMAAVASVLQTLASGHRDGLPTALEAAETDMAQPTGTGSPLLTQFGDPLVYSAIARAHFYLAIGAGDHAMERGSGEFADFVRFFRGMSYYGLGQFDKARDELLAVGKSNVGGIAAAFLAGVAAHEGKGADAREWAQTALNAEKQTSNGEALVALARVQADVGTADWAAETAAWDVVRRQPDSRVAMFAAYWSLGLLTEPDEIEVAKQMYWDAANKRKPDIGHGFPSIYASQQELFCLNYITALAIAGAQGYGLDYIDAYNGMMEISKLIPPSTPVKEGLRWLSIVTNSTEEEEGGKVRR